MITKFEVCLLGCGVVLVLYTDVSEERVASIFSSETSVLKGPHGITSQKTAFFIVTAMKTLNSRYKIYSEENESRRKRHDESKGVAAKLIALVPMADTYSDTGHNLQVPEINF
jgi:hypothetical protein